MYIVYRIKPKVNKSWEIIVILEYTIGHTVQFWRTFESGGGTMEYLVWALMLALAAVGGWLASQWTDGSWIWGLVAGAVLAVVIELLLGQYTRVYSLLIPLVVGAVVGAVVSLLTAPRRAT